MSEDFVSFDLAKKLKEKGFSCEMPFAMYNEIAAFHLLTTSAPYNVCDSGFKYREYYDYEDFDEYDYIAPTISQVLKWLREKDIQVAPWYHRIKKQWSCAVSYNNGEYNTILYNDYTDAAVGGIEYVIDNLI